VEQDEVIRREMDRKSRLYNLKSKNQEDAKKSYEKIFISKLDEKISPIRSPSYLNSKK